MKIKLEDLATKITATLLAIRAGVQAARDAGEIGELPEKVDFTVEVITGYQGLTEEESGTENKTGTGSNVKPQATTTTTETKPQLTSTSTVIESESVSTAVEVRGGSSVTSTQEHAGTTTVSTQTQTPGTVTTTKTGGGQNTTETQTSSASEQQADSLVGDTTRSLSYT